MTCINPGAGHGAAPNVEQDMALLHMRSRSKARETVAPVDAMTGAARVCPPR